MAFLKHDSLRDTRVTLPSGDTVEFGPDGISSEVREEDVEAVVGHVPGYHPHDPSFRPQAVAEAAPEGEEGSTLSVEVEPETWDGKAARVTLRVPKSAEQVKGKKT